MTSSSFQEGERDLLWLSRPRDLEWRWMPGDRDLVLDRCLPSMGDLLRGNDGATSRDIKDGIAALG